MYILKADISNVRSIRQLSWSVPLEQAAGWHVILGDNGSGKSSFLRALALALVGEDNAQALRQSWEKWVRRGSLKTEIKLVLHQCDEFDRLAGQSSEDGGFPVKFTINKLFPRVEADERSEEPGFYVIHGTSWRRSQGWFSAAYGPFRRFTGGDKEYDAVFKSNPRLARHLSLFDERVALAECLDWLRQLRFRQLELEGSEESILLRNLTDFVNQEGFLPFNARLKEVSSKHVMFVDGNGCDVPIEEMSDGYRSILSMTFELIRQLAHKFGPTDLFSSSDPSKIVLPGVVLIDEVDAHLHPTWQRRVGLWFRQHFPNIQFIVTTHSPLVCQAADVGTVFRLPQPGSSEEPAMVTGDELNRLLYGNILDAYGTGLFGSGITRSPSSSALLDRLARLNLKEINEGLSEEEMNEQERLRAALPTSAYVFNSDDAPGS